MSGSTTTSTPKGKARLESEIEKHREEGNWKRCLELAQQLSNETNQQLVQFLLGEIKLEMCLESGKQTSSAPLLKEAKKHLLNCLGGSSSSPLCMDANLLLAKLYYVCGDYEDALKCIEVSGIETVTQVEKTLPLRVMKLVAESFAIKGMSLDSGVGETDEIIVTCLTRASDLTIRYLQNVEKHQGPYMVVNVGPILETALQRAPILHIKSGRIEKACTLYRNLLNACETQSTMNARQIMSRQLAELMLKGVSRSSWTKFDTSVATSSGPWKPLRYYAQSVFVPREREEEILLLLMISEMLAARNVVLDRSPEFDETRKQSLINVMAIYDLMVIVLAPIKYYYLDMFERAVKFSFEVKHIWYQFALMVMESKKAPLRAVKLFEEVTRIDASDPMPCLLASKICITEIDQPERALNLAEEALRRNKTSLLTPKIHIVIGMANSIIFEENTETVRRLKSNHLDDAIKHFSQAQNLAPDDHLPYFHLALLMAHQRAIPDAIKNVQIALSLNPEHIPSIQLLALCLSSLKQYEEALNLCDAALEEFPDQLLLLYIKAHLEEVATEDGRELALLTAKQMLRCCKIAFTQEQEQKPVNTYLTGTNYDTMSLKMEQTLSEVASIDSGPLHGDGTICSSSGITGRLSVQNKQLWNFQLHVWMLIVDLFIQLGELTEAEACIIDGASAIFGPVSHQLMYLKGMLFKAKGQLIEAKLCLQNAISINPKHAKALQQLGHTYHLLGNQLAGDKYLSDSLKADGALHETWAYLGDVLSVLGDHDRAAECRITALQLESTAPVLPFSLIPRAVFE